MVLNIKLLHHTWDFTQYQYSVTSFMFKGHKKRYPVTRTSVRGSPKTRRLKAFKSFSEGKQQSETNTQML